MPSAINLNRRMTTESPHVEHVITRYLQRGGAERNTKYTMRALSEEGLSVSLVTGRNSDTEHLAGEPFSVDTCDHLLNRIDPVEDARAIAWLMNRFQSTEADVVHTHQGKAGLLGRIAAVLAGVPQIIYGLHADHVEHPRLNPLSRALYRSFEQILGRYTDHFVSVGREIQQRYLDRGIGTPVQHSVIPSGMELDRFLTNSFDTETERRAKKQELGVEHPDSLIAGMVASLEPRKGYDDALTVAEQLVNQDNRPDVTFLFAGSGPQRQTLEQRVADKGLQEHVVFTGYREDIAEVMECFDVFLFTSHMEGLPQVLVQAAASGLPVVTFDVEGAKEVILDGRSGFILPDRDCSHMVDRLMELLMDETLREKFGQRAREHVDHRWSIDTMKSKVKQLYATVLSERAVR